MRAFDSFSCFLSVLVLVVMEDVLVSSAAIDTTVNTVISRGNGIPKLKTLDELIGSRKAKNHVSKIAKVTYDDEDNFSSGGFETRGNDHNLWDEEKKNEEIGKAIKFMNFIGQVDNFLASKAKELLRSMHNMIDDKGNIGELFTDDKDQLRDHGKSAPRVLLESWPELELTSERGQWVKRDVGKSDPDLQAKRIQDLEKAKKFMQIVGQVDAYVSDRAKTLLKSLHNIIDHRQGSPSGFNNRI